MNVEFIIDPWKLKLARILVLKNMINIFILIFDIDKNLKKFGSIDLLFFNKSINFFKQFIQGNFVLDGGCNLLLGLNMLDVSIRYFNFKNILLHSPFCR